jgi:UDP-N-acetylmuramate dehydrogenase
MQQVQEHISLAGKTTFQIGGEARYYVECATEAELSEALAWSRTHGVRYAIIGGGSNVLASDDGFEGLVIHIASQDIKVAGELITIAAGRNLLQTIRDCAAQGLGGWEKLAGIPGTVGGAARGNAGAFGSEMQDFVVSVRALDAETGMTREFDAAECRFGYRESYFKRNPGWIITRVSCELRRADPAKSARVIAATITEREKRHLQDVRAAGSYFMNPVAPAAIVDMFESEKGVRSREGRVPAGWLIEKAGFKGAMFGGARASFQHPNYLVNESGTATAAEVRELAETIKEAVREQFGVELQEEAALL